MLQLSKPPARIKGLVLAGGKSSRMGTDKGLISWHGKGQRYHAADLLKLYCEEVFISCRTEQYPEIDSSYQALQDTYGDNGPMGGIISAYRHDPESAWLIVACDLPLLDLQSVGYLIDNRDPGVSATAYQNTVDGLPEPMFALWEPSAYPQLHSALEAGHTSIRRLLRHFPAKLVVPVHPEVLSNVNTPEEAARLIPRFNPKL